MANKIIFHTKGKMGILTLNNPEKHNSFDFRIIQELDNILEKIKKSSLKVIIIRGKGKSFCAGGDISTEKEIGTLNAKEAKDKIKFIQKTFSKIEKLPQVFIAVTQGYVIGGGNELAMSCDIRIALPSAKFMHPETSLGTVAPLGGTKRLPRLIGLGKAKYMLFTGMAIDSKTALDWGLADFLVSESRINPFLKSLVSAISDKPKKSLELTKKSVNQNYLNDLTDEFEADSYVKCSRDIENKKILGKFLGKKKKH